MEILAAIVALEALKRSSEITVVTDSRYLVDAMTKGWVAKWKSKGWMRTNKDKAKNADLWERMLLACEGHEVHWRWVKGHAGHEMNERADQLAVKGRDDRSCQMEDFGFQGMDD
jgi:ribonuclease HI